MFKTGGTRNTVFKYSSCQVNEGTTSSIQGQSWPPFVWCVLSFLFFIFFVLLRLHCTFINFFPEFPRFLTFPTMWRLQISDVNKLTCKRASILHGRVRFFSWRVRTIVPSLLLRHPSSIRRFLFAILITLWTVVMLSFRQSSPTFSWFCIWN